VVAISSRDNIYIHTDERIFYITDTVDEDTISRINFNLLYLLAQDKIKDEKEKNYQREPIHIYINSFGGDVYNMWSLIDIILQSETPIITYCTGYAMSAAFMIFLARDQRIVTTHATLMYHQLSARRSGKFQDLFENQKELDWLQNSQEEYVADRTKISRKTLKENREKKQNWYFHSEDALKYGVATGIVDCISKYEVEEDE